MAQFKKPSQKSTKPRPPVRVRYDPPTLDEAVFAAQGLSDDPAQQIEIAASLMSVPVEEVRPLVLKAARLAASGSRVVISTPRPGTGSERTVIVERARSSRPRVVLPPGVRPIRSTGT
jgi:hypothetical protein